MSLSTASINCNGKRLQQLNFFCSPVKPPPPIIFDLFQIVPAVPQRRLWVVQGAAIERGISSRSGIHAPRQTDTTGYSLMLPVYFSNKPLLMESSSVRVCLPAQMELRLLGWVFFLAFL